MKNTETRAYVYKWTQTSTGKWYIGSRTAKGCSPDDGYICSSKIVKPMIKENPDDWSRQVLCIGHPQDMYDLECKLLMSYDAAHNDMSFNRHNGGKNFCNTGKQFSDEHREKIGAARTGEKHSDATREKISGALIGKTAGANNSMYKGIVIAHNRATGDIIEIIGGKRQLKELGFDPGAVSNCINGKLPHHKNHTFTRIPK